jgi:hypothetical protein
MPVAQIRAARETYQAAGIQHVVVAPTRGDLDGWLGGMEIIAGALDLIPA